MEIRSATAEDWPAIWPFFHEIVAAGESYSYPRDLSHEQGREMWMLATPGHTVVAVDPAGGVLGSAKMNPNYGGGGAAHIASASFMVAPAAAGQGVGRRLGEYALAWARAQGYRGMQFNVVIASNSRAVHLWQSLGFTIVATIPEGFLHPTLGYVGLHIMYQPLS
jgi:L-amino acid N-acyltransferase YncA